MDRRVTSGPTGGRAIDMGPLAHRRETSRKRISSPRAALRARETTAVMSIKLGLIVMETTNGAV